MGQEDSKILELISHSKLELGNSDFDQNCMQKIEEQIHSLGIYTNYYKIASKFCWAGIAVCISIIFLSSIQKEFDTANLILLQSFTIAAICYLILKIKSNMINSY